MISSPSSNATETTAKVIRSRLPESTTLNTASGILNMTPRSLQRKLERESMTFNSIKDSVLFEVAKGLLQGSATTEQIAFELGFGNASSFFSAFQRWANQTPTEWRNQGDTIRPNTP